MWSGSSSSSTTPPSSSAASATPSEDKGTPSEDKGALAAKSDARNDRLRKVNEEVLRKKMQTDAKDLCRPFFQAFGDCAKENGIMVVFNCRQQNQDMSDCMDRHCSEQKFDEYLAVRGIVRPKPQSWYAKYIG